MYQHYTGMPVTILTKLIPVLLPFHLNNYRYKLTHQYSHLLLPKQPCQNTRNCQTHDYNGNVTRPLTRLDVCTHNQNVQVEIRNCTKPAIQKISRVCHVNLVYTFNHWATSLIIRRKLFPPTYKSYANHEHLWLQNKYANAG